MANSSSSSSSGVGVFGLLGVAFVILKLCHVINWSWWWVLLPFYGGWLVLLGILILGLAFIAIGDWLQKRARNKRLKARGLR